MLPDAVSAKTALCLRDRSAKAVRPAESRTKARTKKGAAASEGAKANIGVTALQRGHPGVCFGKYPARSAQLRFQCRARRPLKSLITRHYTGQNPASPRRPFAARACQALRGNRHAAELESRTTEVSCQAEPGLHAVYGTRRPQPGADGCALHRRLRRVFRHAVDTAPPGRPDLLTLPMRPQARAGFTLSRKARPCLRASVLPI